MKKMVCGLAFAVAAVFGLSVESANAARSCGGCNSGCTSGCGQVIASDCGGTAAAAASPCGPAYQEVTTTVMVPETTYESRVVNRTVNRLVTKTREVPVTKYVPETQQVTRNVTKMVQSTQQRE